MRTVVTATFGLDHQARSIVPCHTAATGSSAGLHHFYVATAIPGTSRQKNRISLLSYDPVASVLDRIVVWNVESEVWHMSTSPNASTQSLLAAISPKCEAQILKAPPIAAAGGTPGNDTLEVLGTLSASFVVWDPEGVQRDVRGPNNARGDLSFYSLERLQQPTLSVPLTGDKGASVIATCAAADPHHHDVTAVSFVRGEPSPPLNHAPTGIVLIDERAKKRQFTFPSAVTHGGRVEHVSFSSVNPFRLSTCGADGRVSIWDIRQAADAVASTPAAGNKMATEAPSMISKKASVQAHHHRCYGSLFHVNHDSLLLTWGADTAMKLWQCDATSLSATGADLQATLKGSPSLTDRPKLAACVSDFGESVYSAAWSAQGPWVYAGVSFNGNVLVGSVPSEIKQTLRLGSVE